MIENENKLEISLTNMAEEAALKDHAKTLTQESMREKIKLMRVAYEGMDVRNLRSGIFTNTAINKITECREILKINGDNLPERKIILVSKLLDRMQKIIDHKIKYGEKLSRYLEKREDSLIEQIKLNLLETEMDKYVKIQKKLVSFKERLIELADKMFMFFPEEKNDI
jgi:hypothetical protein